MTLLNQLCRDMNRKIERQKERAIIESSARPLNAEDKARLEAIKVPSCTVLGHTCDTPHWTAWNGLEHHATAYGLNRSCIKADAILPKRHA